MNCQTFSLLEDGEISVPEAIGPRSKISRDLHKTCSYLRHVLEKTRARVLYLLYVKLASYIGRVSCKS